ncbi:hypothetical protein FGO68_gene6242 [Halteria grandinella]|uniref:Uncharacterized protein n=1 Tax=Halteria grandinella TaxID=5974 RepID=A0A8J8SX25_HALGN|nr:hypothetical protein FGO68_gene6242 [Halteria grandinella]
MQDRYVSLDPTFAQSRQSQQDRLYVWERRVQESQGGEYAQAVGSLCGLTTALFFYTRAQKGGFPGFFPLQRIHAGQYGLILGMGYLAYKITHSSVSVVTGDASQYRYLLANKGKIVSGEKPYDRQ